MGIWRFESVCDLVLEIWRYACGGGCLPPLRVEQAYASSPAGSGLRFLAALAGFCTLL